MRTIKVPWPPPLPFKRGDVVKLSLSVGKSCSESGHLRIQTLRLSSQRLLILGEIVESGDPVEIELRRTS